MAERIIGATVLLIIVYYFVIQSDKSSKFIEASTKGYTNIIGAFIKPA